MEEKNSDILTQKEIAFYSNALNAWYTTRFEKDKHLLSLSTAAIGLLITLLTTVGSKTLYTAVIYGLALFCFLICIISVLNVFARKKGVGDTCVLFVFESRCVNA